jgi:hypothetical protein
VAPVCFCGCGRSVRFSRRSFNSSGSRVAGELDWWEAYRDEAGAGEAELPEGAPEFMSAGQLLYDRLAAAVHQDEPHPDGDPASREVTNWVDHSRRWRRKIRSDHAVQGWTPESPR